MTQLRGIGVAVNRENKTQGLEGDQKESMRQKNRLQAQRNHTRSNAYNHAQHKHTHTHTHTKKKINQGTHTLLSKHKATQVGTTCNQQNTTKRVGSRRRKRLWVEKLAEEERKQGAWKKEVQHWLGPSARTQRAAACTVSQALDGPK